MSICTKTGEDHRLEPMKFDTYETTYVCLDCSEQVVQYGENHGC